MSGVYRLNRRPGSVGRISQKVGKEAISWWLSGGIAAVNCIAAYQPKGAASLAASYINLANPGTYNAAPGVAPSFDPATGWTFNGSTTQLTTGVVPGPTGWSLLVAVSTSGYGGGGAGRAVDSGSIRFGVVPNTGGANVVWFVNGASISVSPNITSLEVVGFAGKTAYRGGVGVGTIGAGTALALPVFIGNNSAGNRSLNGKIASLAIYDTTLTAPQMAAVTTAMGLL